MVMTPNITNPYYACVFDGINKAAQDLGYDVFLCTTKDHDPEQLLKQSIEQQRADGAILLKIYRDDKWLQKWSDKFPVVQCCEYAAPCNTAHVTVDDYRAGYEATNYLVGLGRKKVAIIGSVNKVMSSHQRMRGYQDALADAGIPFREEYVAYTDEDYSFQSSRAAARQLMSQDDRPDAIFCIGDATAMSAVIVAQELGLVVPNDVSIVGFDDIVYSTMFHPYLTTVAQPCFELGMKAAEMVHEIIVNGRLDNRNVILPHSFCVRESTCELPEPDK